MVLLIIGCNSSYAPFNKVIPDKLLYHPGTKADLITTIW